MAGTVSATIRINDAFSGALNKLKSGLASSSSAMDKLGSGAGKSTSMFKSVLGGTVIGSGITKGIGMIGNGLHSMYDELNDSKVAWDTFSGNMKIFGRGSQIPKVQAQLQDFATQSIYSASDMASTYSQLAAVGTKNTTALVKGFGGLAASATDPKQAMKTLSQQATQMAAKPKVQWQDFKLMMEQTSGGMAAVAKDMGMPTRELVKQVQEGKIKTDDFFNSIARVGTNKGFTKLATQFKTIPQALDGLKESVANKLRKPWEDFTKIGIKAVTGLTDKISSVDFGQIFSNIVNFASGIGAALAPLRAIAPEILGVVGAFAGLSAITSGLKGINTVLTSGVADIAKFVTVLTAIPAQVTGVFSGIAGIFSALSSPIVFALAAVTVAIVAAVYAWQTNFMGVRDFITSIFSNLGKVFAPLINAFNQLKTALSPVVSSLLPMLGSALGAIGTGAIIGIALGVAVLVDALTNLVAIGGAVVSALRAVWDGLKGVGQALTGNFSGAASSFSKAKSDIEGIGDALQNLGSHNATSSVISALGELDSKAQSTKSNLSDIQIKPKLDTTNVFGQLDSMTANKTANVNVKPQIQVGSNPFAQIQAQANANPVKAKAEVDTSGMANPMAKVQAQATANPIKAKAEVDTTGMSNPLAKLQTAANTTTIKPKVETPTVPTPKMPNATMHVKVATPKVPTPTMPATPTLHVKVATPKIPTPTMPVLPSIPAPHVARPSMAGVVAAVRSGMSGAAAAARAGGAQISAAVRSAINQAVAAARAGAGAMRSAGAMIGAGLAAGMRSQVGAVAAAANALVAQANRAARAAASIHSPSRLFAEIGDYMGQGMALGMNGTGSLVATAGANMAHAAIGGVGGAVLPDMSASSSVPSSSPFSTGGVSPYGTTNNYSGNTNQTKGGTVISFGDIIVQGTGNTEDDAEALVTKIEDYLMNVNERRG